ncbi:TetR/AcrR family transcriptional regulator [Streptomyces sp. NPDC004111]|uniref:TetR/AcrR family transcriptional regulator n=1 Tax=Streptomyces sp. NPDC004111 TaxID=3364690 RepID=UPI0036769BE1
MAGEGIRARQKEQTRRTLLREARRLFATSGYGAVGLAEIVRAAGVSKGALYHQFDSKEDLFRAVLTEVQQEVGAAVARAADAQAEPWDRLTVGCETFLAAGADREVQQIMLIDGPAVLGWSEWRAMDEESSARHLADALHSLVADGTLPDQPVAPLVRLLSGAMNEAALWLAASRNPEDLPATQQALRRLLSALRTA